MSADSFLGRWQFLRHFRNSRNIVETVDSLLYSRRLPLFWATWTKSTPSYMIYLRAFFNIIFTSKFVSSMWYLYSGFPRKLKMHLFSPLYLPCTPHFLGTRSGTFGWDPALQAGRSRVRFPMVSLEFFIDIILPATVWPRVDSACNGNEYQEYFLGSKGGRCWQP
jgi:hypothetical protein